MGESMLPVSCKKSVESNCEEEQEDWEAEEEEWEKESHPPQRESRHPGNGKGGEEEEVRTEAGEGAKTMEKRQSVRERRGKQKDMKRDGRSKNGGGSKLKKWTDDEEKWMDVERAEGERGMEVQHGHSS
ncbi:major centromere autoantigen B-like [Brienomyrus brachyistius]|uniref:major centromere autoantigen B-like n=1 Tax=Brienomyrus brachyistius TaxID=42636 RepID=UPI0020B32816|nr:major centromere autoantigen B-like [Brienomyrus brachyistius]